MDHVFSDQDIRRVRTELARNARLFDRPDTYVAGVEDAVAALIAIARGDSPWEVVTVPEPRRAQMI